MATEQADATVAARFGSRAQVEAAIDELHALGIGPASIRIVVTAGPLVDRAEEILQRHGADYVHAVARPRFGLDQVTVPGD